MPPARVEDPLGDVQPAAGRERQRDLPVAVAALARVPLPVRRVGARGGQPRGDDVAKPGTWTRGVARPSHRACLRLVGDVGALSEDRTFEPAHALNRDASGISDLFRRLAGADTCLDLLGTQRTLHFDLVLGEPGGLAESNRPQPLIDRQDVPPAPPRDRKDSVTAILADRDEAQFLHPGSLPCPAPGGCSAVPVEGMPALG